MGKRYFLKHEIFLSHTKLTIELISIVVFFCSSFSCVEFFIDENPSISISQLCQQAEEQWELSDLSDSGIKCLPDSIFTNKAIQTINGTFPLQIQFLIDISESPFDQLQRLQNKETEVANEQPEFKQKYEKSKKYDE